MCACVCVCVCARLSVHISQIVLRFSSSTRPLLSSHMQCIQTARNPHTVTHIHADNKKASSRPRARARTHTHAHAVKHRTTMWRIVSEQREAERCADGRSRSTFVIVANSDGRHQHRAFRFHTGTLWHFNLAPATCTGNTNVTALNPGSRYETTPSFPNNQAVHQTS